MLISFNLFDAYVISRCFCLAAGDHCLRSSAVCSLRFLEEPGMAMLAVLVAALCLYPLVYWGSVV